MSQGYDIGAGISSAFDLSDKLDTRVQVSLGPVVHNVGSGAKVSLTDAGTSMSGNTDQTSKTDSVASNAKAGDGGSATSTAQLTDAGIGNAGAGIGGGGLGGLSGTTIALLAGGAVVALLGIILVFKKKKKA